MEAARGRQGFEHREAIHVGHLHVQEDEVGIEAVDGGDRLGPGAGFADVLDPGLFFEEAADLTARGRLVVYDQDPHYLWKGTATVTSSPPSSQF